MQRLLGEVQAIEEQRERDGAAPAWDLKLKVKVVGPAQQALRLPDGVRGRETTIERTVLRPDGVQPGTSLLLSVAESSALLAPDVPAESLTGDAGRLGGDFNRDGFVEQRLCNRFVKLDIDPAYGGRMASLKLRRRGIELCARPAMPSHDGPQLGGFADGLTGSGPGDLASAEYQLAEAGDDEVVVTCDLTGPFKGGIVRSTRLEADAPLIWITTTVRRSWDADEAKKQREKAKRLAKGEPSDEDDPDEREPTARYGPRFDLQLGGRAPSGDIELLVPTVAGLRRMPWDWYLWLCDRPSESGWLSAADADAGAGVLVLFQPERVEVVALGHEGEPGFVRCELKHHTVPLKLGEQVTYALALVVADAIEACPSGVAALSLGVPGGGGVPVYLFARGEPGRAAIHCDGATHELELSPVRDRRLGAWQAASLTLPGPAVAGCAEVTLGDERMVLRWNG